MSSLKKRLARILDRMWRVDGFRPTDELLLVLSRRRPSFIIVVTVEDNGDGDMKGPVL